MKNLLKKSLLVLMIVFISVFTLSVSSKVKAADTEIEFALGANGTASHSDGSSKTSYTETVDDYTLSITSGTTFYTGARDAKGNSCFKLGTGKNAGSFVFTVPTDVTSVVIYAAKYKANTSKINVNGTEYTLTKNSNDGAYDEITVDTSSTKTISVTTVSGGLRCMINTITYIISSSEADHECLFDNKWSYDEENHWKACTVEGCTKKSETGSHTGGTAGYNQKAVCEVCGQSYGGVYVTISEAITIAGTDGTYTTDKYYIEGTVTDLYNTQYGNFYITDGTNKIGVYGLYSADGSVRYDSMDVKPVNGDKVVVYGVLGSYNENPQMKNAWLIEHELPVLDPVVQASIDKINSYMTMAYKYTVESSAVGSATITFDDIAKRTSYSTTQQVWSENGITVTNNKSNSTTNVGDYSDPVRCYKSSELVIEHSSNITKITITASGESKYQLNTDTTIEDASVIYNGAVCTIVLNTPAKSFTIGALGNQVRIVSIDVEYESGETTMDTYSNVDFRIRCGVDATLADIEGVQSYGIQVTANNKTVMYTYDLNVAGFGSTTFIDEKIGEEKELIYVVLSLGDLINYNRLGVEFTVQAFAVINDVTYVSESDKTYSIADMVIEYYESGISEVSGLYDLITENLQ